MKKTVITHIGKDCPYKGKESEFQKTAIQLFWYAGIFCWHVPNGGYRTASEAARLKAEGVVSGVADICGVHNGVPFAVELKAKGGRLSDAQKIFLEIFEQRGGIASVCWNVDAVQDFISRLKNTAR